MAHRKLRSYRAKRDFSRTAEPAGGERGAGDGHRGRRYLIQKHDATRLHFDFRLERDGVLLSWAVPNGPSLDPKEKRLAVHVEDHPLDYGDFEGTIPKGEYGGGTVMLWDEGSWEPVGDAEAGYAKGDFKFVLHGRRLRGTWVLVRMKPKRGERSRHENWLLIKERDAHAIAETRPLTERALTSSRSARTMEEIAAGNVEWVEAGYRFKEQPTARSKATTRRTRKPAPPKFVPPQLATSTEAPPAGDAWLHEIKFDGYRIQAAIGGGRVRLLTRTGLDWTEQFEAIRQPLADLPCSSALVDGEAVVIGQDGRTDFPALREALSAGGAGITYRAFDLLSIDGKDLRREPLVKRKKALATLFADQPAAGPLFYSDHVVGHGADMLAQACEMKLEGVVSKRADAKYRSGRTKTWYKTKCGLGQDFFIVGWRPSSVKARPFSSLLLATKGANGLAYRGRVGSGFGDRELETVWAALNKRVTKKAPLEVPPEITRLARFVRPELVAEVEFAGWTGEGYVRHGVFKGLRAGPKPTDINADTPAAPNRKPRAKKPPAPSLVTIDTDRDAGTVSVAGVRITHPDRVVFPSQAITKRRLVDYYLALADHILPHVADRPLSLVRCPSGADGDCFFQKHASPGFPTAFKPIRIKEKRSTQAYLYIEDERGLVASVQMGVLELHIWGSHIDTLEQPDRLVFDFDPDEAVDFKTVREAARDMRARLKALGLDAFVMATGGKGLHVVVPLTPHHEWQDVKAFAEAMARVMAAENPDRYLAEMSKTRRKGRIFVDYLRNGRGATAIAPFSTRARKGAPVAWPVAWSALSRLGSADRFTVEAVADNLKKLNKDPWAGYFDVDQVLPLDALRGR